jgi:drug/metabolite transporter (DMT)-like permease
MKKFWQSFGIIVLSLLVMALWGSLYPLVKIGYEAFCIDGSDIPSILMFAGTRFAVCGAFAFFIAVFKKGKIQSPKRNTLGIILLISFFSIVLHYAFYYIGVATTDSSKSAIMKQLGALLYICFAFLFFRQNQKENNQKYLTFGLISVII